MMASVKQIGEITGKNEKIDAGTKEISNYTLSEEKQTKQSGETVTKTVITTDYQNLIRIVAGKYIILEMEDLRQLRHIVNILGNMKISKCLMQFMFQVKKF